MFWAIIFILIIVAIALGSEKKISKEEEKENEKFWEEAAILNTDDSFDLDADDSI